MELHLPLYKILSFEFEASCKLPEKMPVFLYTSLLFGFNYMIILNLVLYYLIFSPIKDISHHSFLRTILQFYETNKDQHF